MPDDDQRPERRWRQPLPPDDRLWRHPSEVAPGAAAAPSRPGPVARLGPLVAAATLGAGGALLAAWGLGAFADDARVTPVVERVAAPTPMTEVAVGVDDGVDTALAERRRTVVAVRSGGEAGSGVVLTGDGHVLTTATLVADGDRVHVRTPAGTVVEATVLGRDAATDVAVLAVPGLTGPGAVLGDPATPTVGDRAVALAVDAYGAPEVAVGVVATLAVSVPRPDDVALHGLLGTDIVAPVPVEGGALLDEQGAVIGLTTGAGGSTGVLAVPIDLAREVAEDIIATGAARHPWLGVEGRDLRPEDAARWGAAGGAHLTQVVDDGPAAVGGLEVDDVVVQVGVTAVASMGDLVTALRRHDPGDAVRIRFLRNGDVRWCEAELTTA